MDAVQLAGAMLTVRGTLRHEKKQVTFGRSALSARDLTLRLKRWLIAGLDDSHWDEEGQRSFHVNQGGRFMRDFAAGLSEEDCDRIANGEAALAS